MERFAMLIEYLRSVVTEVVIVDTGSLREDIDIMQTWRSRFDKGVKVVETEWNNDFAAARNIGLEQCTQPWTLVLDPDELPTVGMIAHIKAVLEYDAGRPNAIGWAYWTVNYWGGAKGPEYDYHWHCRLFRTGRGKFYRPVHELVALDGEPEETSRGTARMPTAPPLAYLIHSKSADDLANSDVIHAGIERVSR